VSEHDPARARGGAKIAWRVATAIALAACGVVGFLLFRETPSADYPQPPRLHDEVLS